MRRNPVDPKKLSDNNKDHFDEIMLLLKKSNPTIYTCTETRHYFLLLPHGLLKEVKRVGSKVRRKNPVGAKRLNVKKVIDVQKGNRPFTKVSCPELGGLVRVARELAKK